MLQVGREGWHAPSREGMVACSKWGGNGGMLQVGREGWHAPSREGRVACSK